MSAPPRRSSRRVRAGVPATIALCGIIALSALYAATNSSRFWRRESTGVVTYDAAPLAGSRVYKSSTGDVLVLVKRTYTELYVVRMREESSEIAIHVPANRIPVWLRHEHLEIGNDSAVIELPGCAISKELVIPAVPMGSSKTDFADAHLRVGSRFVEFNTLDHARVRATW